MKMIDEYDFDYSSLGFKEYKVNDNIIISSLNVKKENKLFYVGKYKILSCPNLFLCTYNQVEKIKKTFTKLLKELVLYLKVDSFDEVLIVGLGNKNIQADALGESVCSKILATRMLDKNLIESNICTICPNVQAFTGINTFDIVNSLCKEIKPKLIILIDSLITNNIKRIGHSFQLSTCGIVPGGAVGGDKEISLQTTGVKCLTIGVPFMIDLKEISSSVHKSIIVTPKDIHKMVEECSKIIADGINLFFNNNLKKEEIYELLT